MNSNPTFEDTIRVVQIAQRKFNAHAAMLAKELKRDLTDVELKFLSHCAMCNASIHECTHGE